MHHCTETDVGPNVLLHLGHTHGHTASHTNYKRIFCASCLPILGFFCPELADIARAELHTMEPVCPANCCYTAGDKDVVRLTVSALPC